MSEAQVVIIGNVNVDMIMGPQAPWPQPGTEVVLPDYELRPGGSWVGDQPAAALRPARCFARLGVPPDSGGRRCLETLFEADLTQGGSRIPR